MRSWGLYVSLSRQYLSLLNVFNNLMRIGVAIAIHLQAVPLDGLRLRRRQHPRVPQHGVQVRSATQRNVWSELV
jgi:hypothetical protein